MGLRKKEDIGNYQKPINKSPKYMSQENINNCVKSTEDNEIVVKMKSLNEATQKHKYDREFVIEESKQDKNEKKIETNEANLVNPVILG